MSSGPFITGAGLAKGTTHGRNTMAWIAAALGIGGLVASLCWKARVDALCFSLVSRARGAIATALASPAEPDETLQLVGRLISSLRAGISLDASLEAAAAECPPASTLRPKIQKILIGSPEGDFLSDFLSASLSTGVPVLSSLQCIEKALTASRRLRLKARGLTSQCRAQAEVLSWLPWMMAGGIAGIDPSWAGAAIALPLPWLLWGIALALSELGRRWIAVLIRRCLGPGSAEERVEEELLPDLVLRILSEVAQGMDVESATENSLRKAGDPLLLARFNAPTPAPLSRSKAHRLRGILTHASRTGAPLREELTAFLQDIQAETESRWEERVQRLPVRLMAPLFLCYFPGCLCVLASFLVPLWGAGL